MKSRIVFDFDNTLFSSRSLLKAMAEAYRKFGIDEKLFFDKYYESRKMSEYYKPYLHLRLLKESVKDFSLKEFKKELEGVLSRCSDFLYPDVIPFLQEFSSSTDLYLVSFGQRWFQKKKIDECKIERYFKKIYITRDSSKVSVLRKIFKKGIDIFFVDDSEEVLREVKKAYPSVITVKIEREDFHRRGSRVEEEKNQIDYIVKSLNELRNIVMKS
ncbi:MAG: HAD-IA family hydrolase [Candidatus Aenigmarchaeota archaeon]|nr:HAD-IA family hydrolase [Candidatus Aenigmarchaeota archaeon]